MKNKYRQTEVAAAVFCLAISVSAFASEPRSPSFAGRTMSAFCGSDDPNYYEPRVYFTPVFEYRVPQDAQPDHNRAMAKIYAEFLQQKYGYVNRSPGKAMCYLMDNAQMAEGTKGLLIQQARYASTRAQRTVDPVLETDWTLSPGQASATVAKPAAPAPAAGTMEVYGFCFTAGNPNFHSAVFSVAVPASTGFRAAQANSHGLWRQTFGKYVIKNNPTFIGMPQCGAFKTLAEAEAYHAKLHPGPQATQAAPRVETGWRYEAPAG
jgi:hypothetical protein